MIGDVSSVARRIGFIRRQRKLSLDALAKRTRLTKSYLSKIERGLSVPSIASIMKLSRAFGVEVAHLFGETIEENNICIERHRPARANGRPRLNVIPIAPKRKQKTMSPFIMYPSREHDETFNEHAGEEFIYVLRGKVEATFPNRKVMLKSGDSMYFDGHLPHRLRSIAVVAMVEPEMAENTVPATTATMASRPRPKLGAAGPRC